MWHTDLSSLHGNLLRSLHAADDLLRLAKTDEPLGENSTLGFTLLQAMSTIGAQLQPLLGELVTAHEATGTSIPQVMFTSGTCAAELIVNVVAHVAGMYGVPRDGSAGPTHWDFVLAVPKATDSLPSEVRERLNLVGEIPVSDLRRSLEVEIGVAARLRASRGTAGTNVATPPESTEQTSPAARAIALMLEAQRKGRPIPTVVELADIVGCDRSTLFRDSQFKAVRTAVTSTRLTIPRGEYSENGDVEAEAD
jgi:hypothetical protein